MGYCMIAVLMGGPFCGTKLDLGSDDMCIEMIDQIKVPDWKKRKEAGIVFEREFYCARGYSNRGVPVALYEYIGSGEDLYDVGR